MTRKKQKGSSRRLAGLTVGPDYPINNPHLVRLIHAHPGISIHLNEGKECFCEATNEAVMKYQIEKGLKADGIVGPQTWLAMGHNLDELVKIASPDGSSPEMCDGGLEGNPGGHFPIPKPNPDRLRPQRGGGGGGRGEFYGNPSVGPPQRGGGLEGNPGSHYPVDPPQRGGSLEGNPGSHYPID